MANRRFSFTNVVDVYEAASEIGTLLEHISEQLPNNVSVEKLVPKICLVLEQLERNVGRYDKDVGNQEELQSAAEQAEVLRQERAKARAQHEAELEQMQMEWHLEVEELNKAMSTLIAENEKLRRNIGRNVSMVSIPSTASLANMESSAGQEYEEDFGTLKALSEQVSKTKEEARSKNRELERLQKQLVQAEAASQKQADLTEDLKKQNKNLQKQAKRIMEEKNNVILQLRESVLKSISLENELKNTKESRSGTEVSPSPSPSMEKRSPIHKSENSRSGNQPNEEDKPRFTLSELRGILNERNHLKNRVMELYDELQAWKASSQPRSGVDTGTGNDLDSTESDDWDEELAVQGPINREPYDKLYGRRGKKESSIRGLFRALFGEQGIFYNLKESPAHLAD
ncbi:hypothetical protein RvY_10539 [Ramazzottius varieornatus]|uniref:RH1 domain-containing protein n=1 Tax=Ramazzottius varieornatus TaxID=947166 RepID=A0A1D1VKV1_RAMVA|nr:hypothetical protein RvY_10539 [Ramazzottius varieornatus]